MNTDSQFLINSMVKWIHKWRYNGWQTADGRDLANMYEFMELDDELDGSIRVYWVRVCLQNLNVQVSD